MNSKEFAKLYTYERMDISQKVIMQTNQGPIEQVIPQFTMVLKCPNCGEILANLNQDVPEIYVRRIVNQHKEQLALAPYCARCGQKVCYECEIIDVEVEEHESVDM